jgi:hypothetical protein
VIAHELRDANRFTRTSVDGVNVLGDVAVDVSIDGEIVRRFDEVIGGKRERHL